MTFTTRYTSGVVKEEEETIKKTREESIHPKIFIKQTQTINEGGRLYFDVQQEQKKNEKNTRTQGSIRAFTHGTLTRNNRTN